MSLTIEPISPAHKHVFNERDTEVSGGGEQSCCGVSLLVGLFCLPWSFCPSAFPGQIGDGVCIQVAIVTICKKELLVETCSGTSWGWQTSEGRAQLARD